MCHILHYLARLGRRLYGKPFFQNLATFLCAEVAQKRAETQGFSIDFQTLCFTVSQ
jgi:hypothetical protein